MKTKPFDLAQAKAGKVVIPIHNMQYDCKYHFSIQHTNGMALHIFQGIHPTNPPALFIVNDEGESFTTAFTRNITYLDLCMKVEEKEYWIASAYSVVTGRLHLSGKVELTEQNAITQLELEITPKEGTTQTHKIIRYE